MVLQRAWTQRGLVARLLWPLSVLFGVAAALRRLLYASGMLTAARFPVPVIVIGNVQVGGAGKTPVVMALVEHLKSHGRQPGVLSRGHGRSQTQTCQEVHADSDPALGGDEPVLIRRRCGVPVFVSAERTRAAQALLQAHPQTDVLICDDGLQHLRLARDVEVVVFDPKGIGNGWLLPAGPLREPWPRKADLVLSASPSGDQFAITRRLSDQAFTADGSAVDLSSLIGRPLTAVAAIADPTAFFNMLRARGLNLTRTVALPDHDRFEAMAFDPGATLICTEKDAVKLWRRRPDALAVPLQCELDPAFFTALDQLLSTHGRQAT